MHKLQVLVTDHDRTIGFKLSVFDEFFGCIFYFYPIILDDLHGVALENSVFLT